MNLTLKPVPARRGAHWVGQSFRLFGRRPLGFAALFLAFLFAAMLVLFVPTLGGVLQMMLLPLLSLGFMLASQSALRKGPVHPGQFVEGLGTDPARRRALLILCVLYGVGAAALMALCDTISDGAMLRLQQLLAAGDARPEDVDALMAEPGVFWGAVVGLVGATALSVPFWHAPALVHWGRQGVGQALFSSTIAVWRARGAFFVYAVTWAAVVALFGIFTAVVLSLLGAPHLASLFAVPGGLMLSTVFYVSLWFVFDDSFDVRGADVVTLH